MINLGTQVVNTAFDAPVELTPTQQIETVENQLFELAEKGKYGGGFENFNEAVKKLSIWQVQQSSVLHNYRG